MVERLGAHPVVAREALRGVTRVAENRLRLAQGGAVELDQPIAEAHISFAVCELAVWRAAEVVNGAVLMKKPRDLPGMADEIRGEFRADRDVDPLAVRLAEIDHPPR